MRTAPTVIPAPLAAPCSLEGIRYHMMEYHVFTVEDDGTVDIDQPDSFNGRIADCRPYSCGVHSADFATWDEVTDHLSPDTKKYTLGQMKSLLLAVTDHYENECQCDLTDGGYGLCMIAQYLDSDTPVEEALGNMGIEPATTP